MKKSSFFAGCVAVASLALSGSVLAHHGDAGRYIEDVVEITGTVVETQLINPHAILVLDVDTNGKKVRWQAEMGGAQGLIRGGWTKDVKPGTKVTLTGRRLKSGAPYMNLTERARVVVTDTGKEVCATRTSASRRPPAAAARQTRVARRLRHLSREVRLMSEGTSLSRGPFFHEPAERPSISSVRLEASMRRQVLAVLCCSGGRCRQCWLVARPSAR